MIHLWEQESVLTSPDDDGVIEEDAVEDTGSEKDLEDNYSRLDDQGHVSTG